MSPDIEVVTATVSGIAAAITTAALLAVLVSFLWPLVAAVLADYDSARSPDVADWRLALTRGSALRYLCVIGLILCLACGSLLHSLVRFDAWSGTISITAVVTHSIAAVVVVAKAMHRSSDSGHWLREHGLTSFEIGVVEKARALSVLTVSGLYISWAVAVVVPLQLLAGGHAAGVLQAIVVSGAVITPLVLGGEVWACPVLTDHAHPAQLQDLRSTAASIW
ncbi:hypothetical protein [Kribbella sp. NPDC048928]|uniref:hypothetical protein n=1 Tax=Kribbella sp. NPDC048928 TaxID=3364111 RepID=UPI0037108A5F